MSEQASVDSGHHDHYPQDQYAGQPENADAYAFVENTDFGAADPNETQFGAPDPHEAQAESGDFHHDDSSRSNSNHLKRDNSSLSEDAHQDSRRDGSDNPSKKSKTDLCTFFASNQPCPRGNECRFRHERIRICEYYLTPRGCNKGENCLFSHPVKHKKACSYFFSPKGCGKGPMCEYLHDVEPILTSSKSSNLRVCSFYMTKSGCNLRDKCKFSHPPPDMIPNLLAEAVGQRPGRPGPPPRGPPGNSFSSRSQGFSASAPSGHEPPKFVVDCKHWTSTHGCSKGRNCTFKHDSPGSEASLAIIGGSAPRGGERQGRDDRDAGNSYRPRADAYGQGARGGGDSARDSAHSRAPRDAMSGPSHSSYPSSYKAPTPGYPSAAASHYGSNASSPSPGGQSAQAQRDREYYDSYYGAQGRQAPPPASGYPSHNAPATGGAAHSAYNPYEAYYSAPSATPAATTPASYGGYYGAYASTAVSPSPINSGRTCNFYVTQGSCEKGNSCSLIHPVNVKICHFVTSPAGCPKGYACEMYHPR